MQFTRSEQILKHYSLNVFYRVFYRYNQQDKWSMQELNWENILDTVRQ